MWRRTGFALALGLAAPLVAAPTPARALGLRTYYSKTTTKTVTHGTPPAAPAMVAPAPAMMMMVPVPMYQAPAAYAPAAPAFAAPIVPMYAVPAAPAYYAPAFAPAPSVPIAPNYAPAPPGYAPAWPSVQAAPQR